jgi:V8-like Glu-specific endopeptidase
MNTVLPLARNTPTGLALLGSAFAIGERAICTTAHSISQSDEDLCLIVNVNENELGYQDTTSNQVQSVPVSMMECDPIRDIAILEIPEGNGFTFNYSLGSTDDTPAGSMVTSFGFPHADHGRMVRTLQTTAIGARILLGNSGIQSKHIVLNMQTRPGQSGSPIFCNRSNKLIAMLIGSYAPNGGGGISLGGIDPATLHQTTHAVSAEYIREML